ncbi:hypothetical protein N7445_010708 [Penicillium cf. griseofulvum]|nr:hypothetical protein N7445_010708 [Penicillium cf. griseofulvum]
MTLVQYSESESDSEPRNSPGPVKKPRHDINPGPSLPPLPAAFHNLYASSTRVSVQDNPSLHGGRTRVIPHVEGNWPTHLYLEWYPRKDDLSLLADVIAQCGRVPDENAPIVHSLLHSDLGAQLPLHISLSRPVVLRTEQRVSFTETLQKAIHDSHVLSFDVQPDTLYWSSNYEKTRWFLVLGVQRPRHDGLNRLLKLSNDSLARFGQPPLYASSTREQTSASILNMSSTLNSEDFSGCFHISLAWSLSEPSAKERERVARIDLRALRDINVGFDSVKAKIGNVVVRLPAKSDSYLQLYRNYGNITRKIASSRDSHLSSPTLASMQVPSVTLDDLQAFQSKHFPEQLAVFPQENDQTADDLGYYPDGVKRTLTDEQIRIFRHSEIHALLRERELKHDEAQYQGRMQSSQAEGSEDKSDAVPEKRPLDAESQTQGGDQKRSQSRKGSKRHTPEDKTPKLLDYGDDSDQTQRARPLMSQMPYQGRRIISYDD